MFGDCVASSSFGGSTECSSGDRDVWLGHPCQWRGLNFLFGNTDSNVHCHDNNRRGRLSNSGGALMLWRNLVHLEKEEPALWKFFWRTVAIPLEGLVIWDFCCGNNPLEHYSP